jgi:hypothetical protein
MKDGTASVAKQSSQQQCAVLRSSENKAISQGKAIQPYYGEIGIAAVAAAVRYRRFQERGLRSGRDRMVRSPRLGMILLLSPLAQSAAISVQGAFYRKRSTPWPTKRPRLTMTRSILCRSFTVELVRLDSRRSGWNSLRVTRNMPKNAWRWRCHRNKTLTKPYGLAWRSRGRD